MTRDAGLRRYRAAAHGRYAPMMMALARPPMFTILGLAAKRLLRGGAII